MINRINNIFFINKKKLPIIAIFTAIAIIFASLLFFDNIWQFLAIFSVIIVITALAYKPIIGLSILAFLLPATNWNLYFQSLEIPAVDLAGLTLLVIFSLRLVFLWFYNKKQFNAAFKLPIFIPYLIFLAVCLFSSLQAPYVGPSLYYTARWVVFFYAVYIFLPYNIIQNKQDLKKIIASILLSALVVSVMGIISLTQQDFYNEFVRIKPIAINNIYPLGDNQKQISEILIISVFLVFAWSKLQIKKMPKFFYYTLFIFFSLIIIGGFSRAAWIVLFLQLSIYCIYKIKTDIIWRNFLKKYMLLWFLLVVVIFMPLTYYMVNLQFSWIGASSTESRVVLNDIGWQAFLDYPLLGRGSGQFEKIVEDNIYFMAKYNRYLDAHGILQKISTELGLIGLISFFGILCAAVISRVKKIFTALSNEKNTQEFLLYFILSSGGIFLFQFFETSFYKGKVWFTVALLLTAVKLIENKHKYYEEKN